MKQNGLSSHVDPYSAAGLSPGIAKDTCNSQPFRVTGQDEKESTSPYIPQRIHEP
jgi:hypothetical protein